MNMNEYLAKKGIVPVFSENTSEELYDAYESLAQEMSILGVPGEHLINTPERVVASLHDMFHGLRKDPREMLEDATSFTHTGGELITLDVPAFSSFCAHHLLPFTGWYRFSYLPATRIVGLSKIPRFISTLCARPQIQELLSSEITQLFQEVVEPVGCGIIMSATHGCMSCRGVRQSAITHTTSLRGLYLTQAAVKDEFLRGYSYK